MKYVVAAATLIFAMQASAGYKWGVWPHKRLVPETMTSGPIERMYKWQWKR